MKMARDISRQGRANASRKRDESGVTQAVKAVFSFVRLAEFEILFFLFFIIVFVMFKQFTSLSEYNQILVKKPGDMDWWPY